MLKRIKIRLANHRRQPSKRCGLTPILYSEPCAYIALEHLSNALSKLKYLAAKRGMFEPT